ncbi:MAG: hypothetical protein RLZZ488_2344 [Pseudomonadota bacterium]|jgi:hypothetical protein
MLYPLLRVNDFRRLGLSCVSMLTVAIVLSACKSVSPQEKDEVIERIVGEDAPSDGAKATPEIAAPPALIGTPGAAATPDVTVTPEVKAAAEAENLPRQKPKMPARQSVARLPLPRGVAHSDLLQFINAHAEVISPYQPMQREWNSYARAFASQASAGELELEAMRLRISQDFPRAHWLFVWGLHQTSLLLLNQNGKSAFLIDRQEDFLARISVMLFLSGELDALTRRSEYRDVLRRFYKYANVKYFKRKLSDRPEKPEGLLRPERSPRVPVNAEEQD